MKDARFTELVNLYVDRQISPDEAAELEAELQSNPRRRQVYQQYCRMHRATKLVYESFRAHADQGTAAPTGPSTIARFESRKRAAQRSRWMYGFGSLAAAACVAFAVVRSGTFQKSGETLTQNELPKVSEVATTASAPVAPSNTASAAVRSEVNSRAEQPDYEKMLLAIRQDDQKAFAIKSLFDDGVFDNKQTLPADSRRVFPNKPRQNSQPAEFTAFQFQR